MLSAKFTLQRSRAFSLIELLLAVAILGVLISIALPRYSQYIDKTDYLTVIADLNNISQAIERYRISNSAFPASLNDLNLDQLVDPWGNPYRYLNITTEKGKGKLRKDKNLVPINNDYDLYSMGKDGKSVSPLTSALSRDDIIRANNGGFYGYAKDY